MKGNHLAQIRTRIMSSMVAGPPEILLRKSFQAYYVPPLIFDYELPRHSQHHKLE